ncbi:hypothetical protein [Cohnella boryungensis]|uniref:DUF2642 domain-containing protein n=1 Tax=Cohnella boryungensis TaxID=768479 RepID=A0ABV8SGA5_9BACL
MAVENTANPLAPGTQLGALLMANAGRAIAITTAAGEMTGTLESCNSTYIRVADDEGTKYVLCSQIIAVSFPDPSSRQADSAE